jgi:hypothetical protein
MQKIETEKYYITFKNAKTNMMVDQKAEWTGFSNTNTSMTAWPEKDKNSITKKRK